MPEDTSYSQLIADLNVEKVKDQSPFIVVPVVTVTGEFEGALKKIKVENGLITELEVE